ncbi:sorbosone dehydrogenase family protein [Pedobacter sp. LMG 31462]|uniref:Sorbosone dehydrogenase family protein n=2 Tax=Pedobacter gandavensis TaxID=2679963 RepID=A0ABR6EWP2_9SPHI|nr:sorbosone dehydrogenase family protein [Pedobacter gandavensis]
MKYLAPIFCLMLCIPLLAVTCNRPMEKLEEPRLKDIKLPEGFKIEVFAKVDNPRSMALGANGTVFVGNRDGDKVYALVDENKDGIAEKTYIIAQGLKDMPNGVAFKDGNLYVAEISKIWRYDNIEKHLANPPKPVLVYDKLPTDTHHGWKYIAFGPDGKLYVPIGAPCNICDNTDKDKRYASITRMNPDGTGFEIFANGVRNSVGFDWNPLTKDLWFTDNGRDMLGDDIPADELNRAEKPGMHFGYPFVHAGDLLDPEFGKGKNPKDYTPPQAKLNAHTAALGMKFYTGDQFPKAYKNQIFIAEHGSWNRKEPTGYRVTLVKLDGNKVISYEPFASGWLKNGKAWGRPVDVLQLKDGSLLVSDDFANLVYRITYDK